MIDLHMQSTFIGGRRIPAEAFLMKTCARPVYNADSRSPGDFTLRKLALRVIRGAVLTDGDADRTQRNAREVPGR